MANKREEFLKSFAAQVEGARAENLTAFTKQLKEIRDKKFKKECEMMKPTIGEIADGYKRFIIDLGGPFLNFAEIYNQCIQVAKKKNVIRDVNMKVRIKDFSSSFRNTDDKILDDVFGMQLAVGPEMKKDKDGKIIPFEEKVKNRIEEEKEFLMLFNNLIIDVQRHKKYNKNNGYRAYHCTGDFCLDTENIQERVIDLVENMVAREYKYSKHEPQYEKNKMIKVFPLLSEKLKDNNELEIVVQTLKEMIEVFEKEKIIREEVPLIEFHFMTSDVEEISINGTASHSLYKKENDSLVKQFFRDGRLIRGINLPWKFGANESGLYLLEVYSTAEQNSPALRKDIDRRRKEGKEQEDIETNKKFDLLSASVFPFLRKYIGKSDFDYREEKQSENWGLLKAITIANRIDFSKGFKSLGQTVLEGIGEIV